MSAFYGKQIQLSVFGQSHSRAIGVTVEHLPAGIPVNEEKIQAFLQRRAPSGAAFSTARKEADRPVFLGGVYNGYTTGGALCAIIENTDARSRDYAALVNTPRPGHADYGARIRYGGFADPRGGGAFSGRMTAALCIAGAVALAYLEEKGITVGSHILSVGPVSEAPFDPVNLSPAVLQAVQQKPFGVLCDEKGAQMQACIEAVKAQADSVGGVVEAAAVGLPWGLGGELFDGLESRLAQLLFAVPAVKGISIGAGFEAAALRGSENNDSFYYDETGAVKTRTNRHGGLLGGITTSMPLLVRTAFKPTPSIGQTQQTVNLQTKQDCTIAIAGRHDACVVPRALPVVEACLAIALLDEMLSSGKKE